MEKTIKVLGVHQIGMESDREGWKAMRAAGY
jgi:hypothetical protein